VCSVSIAQVANDEYDFAMGLYKQKRWALCVESLNKFLQQEPNSPRAPLARLYCGQALVNLGQYQDARATLRIFVEKYPQNKNMSQVQYRVAECSYFMDDYPAAIKEFNNFMAAHPEDPLREWALPYLADSLLKDQKPQDAVKTFQLALTKFPKGALAEDSQFGLARSYEILKDDVQAEKVYRDIVGNPQHSYAAKSLNNLGFIYYDQQKFAAAEGYFEELLTKFPQFKEIDLAQINAGYCAYHQQKFPQALERFQAVRPTSEQFTLARYWQAVTYQAMKNIDQAEQDFTKLSADLQVMTERNADQTSLLTQSLEQLASLQYAQKKYPAAVQTYQTLLPMIATKPNGQEQIIKALEAAYLARNKQQFNAWIQTYDKTLSTSAYIIDFEVLKSQVQLDAIQTSILTVSNTTNTPDSANNTLDDKNLESLKAIQQNLTQQAQEPNLRNDQIVPLFQTLAKSLLLRPEDAPKALQVLQDPRLTPAVKQESPDFYLLQGLAEYHQQHFEQVIKNLDQYQTLFTSAQNDKQYWELRLLSLAKSGDETGLQQALVQLAQNIELDKNSTSLKFRVAESLYQIKKQLAAIPLYQTVIDQTNPATDATLYCKSLEGLGWCQYEAGQYDEAHTTFLKLKREAEQRQLKLQSAQANYVAGLSLLKLHKYEAAIDILKQGYDQFHQSKLEGDPATRQAQIETCYLAYHCAREAARADVILKKFPEAHQMYEAGYMQLRIMPQDKRANLDKYLDEWALMHYQNEQFDSADDVFRILVKETPDSDLADNSRLILAESDYANGKIELAKDQFGVLMHDPKADEGVQRRALYQLVSLAATESQWTQLLALSNNYLRRFSEPAPQYPDGDYAREVKWRHAQALLETGKTDDGIAELKEVLAWGDASPGLKPDSAHPLPAWSDAAFVHLAEGYRRIKDYDQCEKIYNWFKDAYPESSYVQDLNVIRGRALISQAKFTSAREIFEKVIAESAGQKTSAAAQSHFYMAETFLMQKNYPDALKHYLRVALIYPQEKSLRGASLFQVGQCEEVLGNIPNAIKSYQDLIQAEPQGEYTGRAQERLNALK
jgi:TolA-binding protein